MNRNGMQTFAFHTQDEDSAEAVHALLVERPAFPGFATTETIGLANLSPETAAMQHLQQALACHALPQLTTPEVNGNPCEFKSLGSDTLPMTGTTSVKFRQFCNKIPVYGSLITVEIDEHNELVAINSAMGIPDNVDQVAKISPAQARDKVRTVAGYGDEALQTTPRLFYYFDESSNGWRLVYIIEDVPVRTSETKQTGMSIPLVMDYVIDAHSGDLLAELSQSRSAAGPIQEEATDGLGKIWKICCMEQDGNKIMHDPTTGVHTFDLNFQDVRSNSVPGNYVGTPPPPWEPAAVSAHNNAAIVARFLREVLGRNGIDNGGGPLFSSVNCIDARRSPDGKEWRNAQWNGTQMFYGQKKVVGKDGKVMFRSYALGLDIVAHEIFHGVTSRTAGLKYQFQAGALDESYSDIFGILVSNREELNIAKWNWQLGEDVEDTGIPIRDFQDPTKYKQPIHMVDFKTKPYNDDFGGVHTNSGIHNFAAYKIMTAQDSQGNYLFDLRSLAALFYLALTQYLTPISEFSDSRKAISHVAKTLFRRDPANARKAKLKAISDAFVAVGIEP
jgi:Zn-dependent metalloprotease